jgi:ribose 5-phosphate isomerase A
MQAASKRRAAESATGLVESGMVVGLGSGTTAEFAVHRLAERLEAGELRDVVGVPTSTVVAKLALALGIPLTDLSAHPTIDLTIDGADEVDPQWNLIKGGGGALLREKIVAQATRREVIVVDDTKLSPRLGTHHRVPVEVVDFGWRPEALHLESLGAKVDLRSTAGGSPFRTDGGNFILDADMGPLDDPAGVAASLMQRAGVVEVGLFVGLVDDLVVGSDQGVEHRSGRRAPFGPSTPDSPSRPVNP